MKATLLITSYVILFATTTTSRHYPENKIKTEICVFLNHNKQTNKKEEKMLQLFFTIAFSAAPLTLYIPPIRCLTVFVETMEEMGMEGRVYSRRVFPRARIAWSRLLDCFLSSSPRRPWFDCSSSSLSLYIYIIYIYVMFPDVFDFEIIQDDDRVF